MLCAVVVVSGAVMKSEKPGASDRDPLSLPASLPGSSPGVWWGHSGVSALLALCMLMAALFAFVFLLYRFFRTRTQEAEDTSREREHAVAESTEQSTEGGSEESETDSSEVAILSSVNHTKMSPGLFQEHLRETSHENLNEPSEDLLAGISDMKDISKVGRCSEYTGLAKPEDDAVESIKVESDLLDYRFEGKKPVPNELETNICDIEECETELHGDVDEPSETESAQETLEAKNVPVHKCQSMEDLLDNTLLAQDAVSKPSKIELLVNEPVMCNSSETVSQSKMDVEMTKIEDDKADEKGFKDSIDRDVPQLNEFDHRCYEKQLDLSKLNNASDKVKSQEDLGKDQNDSNGSSKHLEATQGITVNNSGHESSKSRYEPVLDHPPQSYLGFTTPSLPGEPMGQVQVPDMSREKSEVTVGSSVSAKIEASHDKNEINIMEAIMDSNEWLSTGPPDTRELPWLTQTQSNIVCGFKTGTSLIPATNNTSYGCSPEVSQLHQEKVDFFTVAPEDIVIAVVGDEEDCVNKKVAAVSPMPQMVRVSFRVHYITHSPSQLLAVTGNQQELGTWESFVPLQRVEDWFWANTIALPTEKQVEWKFVLVEDGKIRRWEECENRHFVVNGQEEEIQMDKSWGYV
ncbi:uncharacterized protein stbd1 [Hoplias malabaricus]|uniref:uncharacterized protein stbd1 n=1 Tax=Hoplias malabaricus TaxID=27720 RepID=UPI003462BD66